jgi:RimJ/RimL family protein N-acetyltransferase
MSQFFAPLRPITLTGRHVTLAPLSPQHGDELIAAVLDGELWRLWYTSAPEPEKMDAEIARRLALQAAGSMLPFTAFDQKTGRAAGMTTFMNIDNANWRVEIGSTWTARSFQRTALNTEAKLLLLAYAFDDLDCIAVEFRTHFLNHPSRRAIERLGARLDGVLRRHQWAKDGTARDTCVYSIIPSEWPAVRSHLMWQLEKPR